MSSLRFSDSKEIDAEQVWELYRSADWAKDRTLEETQAILAQSSLVLSLWEGDRLVAFARGLTDFVVRVAGPSGLDEVLIIGDRRGFAPGASADQHGWGDAVATIVADLVAALHRAPATV